MKSKSEYIKRINNAIDFIDQNLDQAINLEVLAQVANFSTFHFHRIFVGITGETPNQYIKRRRLEKAANSILFNHKSMTQIAHECGFSSSATFSRAFKDHFHVTPSQWLENSKNCKTDNKNGKASQTGSGYDSDRHSPLEKICTMKLEIRNLPKLRIAYVANLEGYNMEKVHAAWERLLRWASPRGLVNKGTSMIGIPFDNPDITDPDKCRYYACIDIDNGVQPSGDIGKMEIQAGQYAVYTYHGIGDQVIDTYRSIYSEWFPNSGYQPDDAPFFEKYLVDATRINEELAKPEVSMEICIPVKPL